MAVSVGRIVHYMEEQGDCITALVTKVNEGEKVELTIFPPSESTPEIRQDVEEGTEPGTWHWPELVL